MAALIEAVILTKEPDAMVVLEDVITLPGQWGPEDDFNFKAAATPGIDGALTVDVGVCVSLIGTDNDDTWWLRNSVSMNRYMRPQPSRWRPNCLLLHH